MPDVNKLAKMNRTLFRIAESCASCIHRPRYFGGATSRPWGFCKWLSYEHSKYGERRPFPAHVACVCCHYELDPYLETDKGLELGQYAKILNRNGD
jgi:hypothetical protein